ncbi:MAG: mechanosensitive ion channel protein MscS [Crocinitomicaceae bacterium]|nr:mechanosensitive ion channel protein MscS [Crocinitomicaceae bacterium]|tara:strand:- start:4035 stop:5345 length:1311 start_codon:yes stop_codon:yes gene_type:complete
MDYGKDVADWIYQLLIKWGVPQDYAIYVKLIALIFIVAAIAWVVDKVARQIILQAVSRIASRTKTDIDDILVEHHVFRNIAHIAPAIFIRFVLPVIFSDFQDYTLFFREVIDIYIIVAFVLFFQAVLRSMNKILRKIPLFKDKPVESYTQLLNIVNYVFGFLFIVSELTGKSLVTFFTALGAASAVLILTFKDTILGFVASIQLSANDMVKVGDWVSFEKYGADGDVIEINLTTIKVQNFDKTITTIPTYAFISDAFKNWRGMQESDGRRIKRSISFKISSVRFCTPEMLERYRKYQLVADYIDHRQHDINDYNTQNNIDKSELINGRNMTNLGIFRKYMLEYLEKHPAIHKEMTLMVRQLEPTEIGVPLEVYCFSKDQRWVNYEYIMSDLFDHYLSAARYFDLEIFERPTGTDFATASQYSVEQKRDEKNQDKEG